jgi:subtilisin family serine protease
MKTAWFKIILASLCLCLTVQLPAQIPTQSQERVVPGEVVIKYKAGVAAASTVAGLQAQGVAVIKSSDALSFVVGKFSAQKNPEEVMAALRGQPNVEYVEPNYKVYVLAPQSGAPVFPNDARFSEQWSLYQSSDNDIDAPEAWSTTTGSDDVIIGIIDTGIDYGHEDLNDNVWSNPGESGDKANNGKDDDNNGYIDDFRGWNFAANNNDAYDDNDHGTHVAGIAGAVGNNGIGIAGVCWKVKLMPLKFLGNDGSGSTADAASAIVYAVNNGARILNNSWGGGEASQIVKDAITFAHDRGVLFIAAAGGSGTNNDEHPTYPANYEVPNIISVASSDREDKLASNSNYGPSTVHLAAPGVDILSAMPNNRYQRLSAGSMAAPHVAGACALVWARYPHATMAQVMIRLLGSVDRKASFIGRVASGGRLNAAQALSTSPVIANTTEWNDTSNTAGPYEVKASVVDDDSLARVLLVYRVNDGVADSLEMKMSGNDTYSAGIPGKPAQSRIAYQVMAMDKHGNRTFSPTFSFKVTGKTPEKICCGQGAVSVKGLEGRPQAVIELPLNLAFFLLPIILLRRKKRC